MRSSNALLFSVLLVIGSLHYIFARLLFPHIAPTASAALVMGLAAVEVFVFALATRQFHWRAFRAHMAFYLAIGALIAASTALSYESIAYLDAGTASMLSTTTTLFTVVLGLVWLHESLTPRQIAGTVVALIGAFVIAFQPGDYLRFGALLVLLSSLLYALHTALVKRYGSDIAFIDFFVFRLMSSAAFLLLFAGARGVLAWPDGVTWLLLLLTATIDVVVSRTLYYVTLRRIPMSIHAVILTLSPVIAIGIAWLLFRTLPNAQQLAGGAAILLGVLMVTWRTSAPVQVDASSIALTPVTAPSPATVFVDPE
jgi:drug/metabolite transporter (DMT)-like permease